MIRYMLLLYVIHNNYDNVTCYIYARSGFGATTLHERTSPLALALALSPSKVPLRFNSQTYYRYS